MHRNGTSILQIWDTVHNVLYSHGNKHGKHGFIRNVQYQTWVNSMKTVKRVFAIFVIIILSLVIGYLVYTGSRLADVQNGVATIIGEIQWN